MFIVNALILLLAVDFVWFGYFTSFDKLKLNAGIHEFRVSRVLAHTHSPATMHCFPCQHFVPVLSLGAAPAAGRVSILACSLCPGLPSLVPVPELAMAGGVSAVCRARNKPWESCCSWLLLSSSAALQLSRRKRLIFLGRNPTLK